ncbi:MAG: MATE family efflux transporter [Clostridium sp.]
MDRQKRLGEESIPKLLMTFSIPAIIGMVVNTLYNVIDRIFIGNIPGIGKLAITGVGITLPIMTIILGFGLLIGVGTSARISITLGQGRRETAEKLLGNAVTLIIIFAVIITILGFIFMNPLLVAFGASPDTLGYAKDYIGIIFLGTIFSLGSVGLNHSIRSDGNPKIAMLSMLLGAGVNIILDPILIFGFNMGVKGAAIATVFSQLISALWIFYYFTKGKSILKIRKKNLKLKKAIILSIFSIGMSPFAMQIAQSLVQVVANTSLKHYGGDTAIGAMTIITSISLMATMPIIGINQGAQPIIGYNFGAKKYHRVLETIKYSILFATIIVTSAFLIIQFAPHSIIKVFNNDPILRDMATKGVRIYLFMLPIIGVQIVASSYFQAIGKAKISMFLSLLRQVIILIPLILIFPTFKGLDGIWFAGPTADFISTIIASTIFFISLGRLKSSIRKSTLNIDA